MLIRLGQLFIKPHSHTNGFYCGYQCSWTLIQAKSMQVSIMQFDDHNKKKPGLYFGQLFIPTSGRTAGRFSTGQRLLKMLIKTIKVKVVGMMMTVFDLDDGGFIEVDFGKVCIEMLC